jgi:hypothetical protein
MQASDFARLEAMRRVVNDMRFFVNTQFRAIARCAPLTGCGKRLETAPSKITP